MKRVKRKVDSGSPSRVDEQRTGSSVLVDGMICYVSIAMWEICSRCFLFLQELYNRMRDEVYDLKILCF
jgi:hypothetical protein